MEAKAELKQERSFALSEFEEASERPMIFLAVVWLVLTIFELLNDLSPFLENVMTGVWAIFWIEFVIRFVIAPRKIEFLKHNVITLLSLALPAFRVFRAFRVLRIARATRGLRLLKLFGSFNRGMRALRLSLGRRGFSYVLALSFLVILLGSAGIYFLERDSSDYFTDFGTAVWWTAMMLTTMGSDYFPKSSEARLLTLALAIYGFAVFGYVTASVATFFIDRDAEASSSQIASQKAIEELKVEIRNLRTILLKDKEI